MSSAFFEEKKRPFSQILGELALRRAISFIMTGYGETVKGQSNFNMSNTLKNRFKRKQWEKIIKVRDSLWVSAVEYIGNMKKP